MRKAVILALFAVVAVAVLGAQRIALTSRGETVLLLDDGTWDSVTTDDQIVTTPKGDSVLIRPDGSWIALGGQDVKFLASAKAAGMVTPAPEVIKLGWLGPLTGDSAFWGTAELNALTMLANDWNTKGGIKVGGKARMIRIISYDDKGDSAEAVSGAKRLVGKDRVCAIIGPQGSGEAIPIAPILNQAMVPAVATTATNPRVTVTESGSVNKAMFRACFTDPYQGNLEAYFAWQKLGVRRAALFVTDDDFYSTGLAQHFKETFERLGGQVVVQVGFTTGEKDFQAQLARINAADPDIIFMPVYYNDVGLAARQARDLGMTQVMLGGDGWPSDNLVQLAGDSLEGCYFINHVDMDDPDPKAAAFKAGYKARYNRYPELNSYLAYDAFLMVVDAIRRAGSTKGADLIKALETTDIQGLSGHIRIGPTHDPVSKDGVVMKIVGPDMVSQGRFVGKE